MQETSTILRNDTVALFERLREELKIRNLKFKIISGGYEERTLQAVKAVEMLLI